MAYYYVKNGGTATGDGGRATVQRTGLWNSTLTEYYDNVEDAVGATTTPGDSDYILISHLATSSWSLASTLTFNASGTSGDPGLQIISVDNANQENYLPGASQTSTHTSNDFKFGLSGLVQGVSLTSGNTIGSNSNCRFWRFVDSTLKLGDNNSDLLLTSTDGAYWELLNSTLDFTTDPSGVSGGIQIDNACTLVMRGGSVPHNLSSSWRYLTKGDGANGGATMIFDGVDLSTIDTALINGVTLPFSNDTFLLKIIGCKMATSYTVFNNAPLLPQWRTEIYNSDDATSDNYHHFYIEDGTGVVENNDATYVTATKSWYEGSAKSSIEVITTSITSHVYPLRFELLAQYVDLSSTSSDVLTVNLVTDLTLTDTDLAAFLKYSDGTTAVIANWVTSGKTVGTGNFGIDPLSAGTTLATSSLGAADWTGEPASPNFYKLELDTTGDPGQACVVSIYIEVYKPSIAAGSLFIHPLLTVS